MIAFNEKTIRVTIDDSKCGDCRTKACIRACGLYSRGLLRLKDGKPTLLVSASEIARVGTECLGCEYECRFHGAGAIRIYVPMPELDEFKRLSSGLG